MLPTVSCRFVPSTQTQNGNPPASAEALLPKPPVAGALTVTQVATATTALLTALRRFQYTRGQAFDEQLRHEAEEVAPTLKDVVDNVISRELGFEATFRAKQYDRVSATLGPALSIPDREKRERAVRAIFERERRYTKMREAAMRLRVLSAVRHHHLEQASPQGAYWLLGEGVKSHTLDCCPGWVRVQGPQTLSASSRPYTGKLVHVVLASGQELSVTPNHPVLTRRGWVGAGALRVGDDVFASEIGVERDGIVIDDIQDRGAPIQEVFETVKDAGSGFDAAVNPLDFHSDGADGHVHVVRADSSLRQRLQAASSQGVSNDALGICDPPPALLASPRVGFAAGEVEPTSSASRGGASTGLLDAGALGRVESGECLCHGGAATPSDLDAALEQRTLERGARDASLIGQTLDGLSAPVAVYKVVQTREFDWSGHVYNLSTAGGWYMADGVVVRNCLAMANRAWPWVVLHSFQPPVHYGCQCSLLGLNEAIAGGLMRPSQVPNEAAALRLATERLQSAANAMRNGDVEEGDIGRYLSELGRLEEAPWSQRFSAGTTKGGEFAPKAGGDPGAALLKRLGLGQRGETMRKLMPTPHPLALSDRGQWRSVNGKQYRIPLDDEWRRQVGGAVYHSPAGTTNVYKSGELLSLPSLSGSERSGVREKVASLVSMARSRAASRREPLRAGDGPEHVLAMDERGFVPTRLSPHGAGAWKISYVHDGNGSEVHAVVGKDGRVQHAHWQSPEIPEQHPSGLLKPPTSFRQHTGDAMAWAHELGKQHGTTVRIKSVDYSNTLEDHAGFRQHNGATSLGHEVKTDIEAAARARKAGRALTEDEKRGVWASFQTTAHEVAHSVNPIHPEDYHGEQANLEEALTEEASHPLAAGRLAAQGQHDVLEWRKRNADDRPVKGVYRRERGALADVLDRAGVTDPGERASTITALKFQVDPAQRFRVLGALIANHDGSSVADAEDWARRRLRKGSKARGAVPASPGWAVGKGKPATGLAGDQKLFDTPGGGQVGHAKPKPPPLVIGGHVPEPEQQGPIPSFEHLPLSIRDKAYGFGKRAMNAVRGGEDWVVKEHHGDKHHVASELLANAIYRHLGVNVPLMGRVQTPGAPDFSQIPDAIDEPPVDAPSGTRISAGLILREKNGKVTLIEPRNHYGGYVHTFPKGGQEAGLSTQQTALKELWEETGLHGHITGVVGDFKGDTGVTRYYVGVRTGGEPTPSDETQAIKTVTVKDATEMLNRDRDKAVLQAVQKLGVPKGKFKDEFPAVTPGLGLAFQKPKGKSGEPRKPSDELASGYMADALLGNWGFADGDNLRWQDGSPMRVGHAGALEFRPSGEPKEFGAVPQEAWTMRFRGGGRLTPLSEDQMRDQARVIGEKMTDGKIDQLVDSAPFPTQEDRDRIREALRGRVAWMRQFGAGEVDLPAPAEGGEARGLHEDAQRKFQLYPEEDQAITDYLGDAGREFDKGAHDQSEPTDTSRRIAKHLDNVLNDARTVADSVAYIPHSGDIGSSLVGQTVRQRSFTLAHTDVPQDGKSLVRVLLPGGSHAFYMDDAGPDEPDMLIHRGARMRFSAVSTGPDGRKVADAILLPYERPHGLPGGYKSVMSQTKIKPSSSKPKIYTGDKVKMASGVEGRVEYAWATPSGKRKARVVVDGKMYEVPAETLERLTEAALIELVEAEQTHTGVMVALHPHPSTQRKFALPGGEPPSELHVTLAFLGKQDELEDPDKLKQTVGDWAQRTAPLEGEVSGHGLFTAGDTPVTYLSPDLPGLPAARQDLVDSLAKAGMPPSKTHSFTPHLTLAYADRTAELPDHGGHPLKFRHVSVVIGGERTRFKFGGEGVCTDRPPRRRDSVRGVDSAPARRASATSHAR